MYRSKPDFIGAVRGVAGFTLIEVLLVVVIVSLLAAVAIPRFSGRVEEARVAKAEADIHSIGLALRMYEVDNGHYPPTLQGLLTAPAQASSWRGPYLEKGIPRDPWGRDYIYTYPGVRNPHAYDLKSLGPDGVESSADIGNWMREGSS